MVLSRRSVLLVSEIAEQIHVQIRFLLSKSVSGLLFDIVKLLLSLILVKLWASISNKASPFRCIALGKFLPDGQHGCGDGLSALLEAESHLVSNLGPVGTYDNESESNIEDNTCDTVAKPETDDAHLTCEGKDESQWHADYVITEESV